MSSTLIKGAHQATGEIYRSVIENRSRVGQEILGFGVSEVFKTDVGMYGPTEEGDLSTIVSALNIDRNDLHILDLGSGTGQLIMPLALLNPNLFRISGIEFDRTLVEESLQALDIAVQRQLIRRDQVHVHQGDFFDPRHKDVICDADRIFYYLGSSDSEDNLADYLGMNISKPDAQIVAYGDHHNPFPILEAKYGFSFHHSSESLISIYSKGNVQDE